MINKNKVLTHSLDSAASGEGYHRQNSSLKTWQDKTKFNVQEGFIQNFHLGGGEGWKGT